MKKSGVDAVLSASLMQEKFPQFPWPPNVLDIGDWLREKSRKKAELAWETLLVLVLPMRLRLKPRKEFEGKDSEGALLLPQEARVIQRAWFFPMATCLRIAIKSQALRFFQARTRSWPTCPFFTPLALRLPRFFP